MVVVVKLFVDMFGALLKNKAFCCIKWQFATHYAVNHS